MYEENEQYLNSNKTINFHLLSGRNDLCFNYLYFVLLITHLKHIK